MVPYSLLLVCVGLGLDGINGIICRDPDLGGQQPERANERKFLLFGCEECTGAGFGNQMIFFPSAYYFAALTGRDLLIFDNSVIGEFCKHIECGFPMVSKMSVAYPELLGKKQLENMKSAKVYDFRKHMDGSKLLEEYSIIRADGYMPASEWWVYYNGSSQCIERLTGCEKGDISCTERHAFQRLVRGPFKSSLLTVKDEERLIGLPPHIKHAILSLPHNYAPRVDLAVHLRSQFHHFEELTDINDPKYKKEVQDWLNSTEGAMVFKDLDFLVNDLISDRPKVVKNKAAVVYLYLASDNEEVKEAFADYLLKKHPTYKVLRVKSKFIVHIKNMAKLKSATDNEGIFDLLFDWYALTLSDLIVAWRRGGGGGSHIVSTFVHSAQRVSGTIERTNTSAPIGHGIGTRGIQMSYHKGRLKFEDMWTYAVMDDFVPDKNDDSHLHYNF